jgi:hypothetical protein
MQNNLLFNIFTCRKNRYKKNGYYTENKPYRINARYIGKKKRPDYTAQVEI